MGGFEDQRAQANMPSLHSAAADYGHVDLDDGDITVVHLLLYGMDMNAPSVADARAWSDHYGLTTKKNHVVLVGDARMLGPKTMAMIPGLQLVDRDFVLRYDAAGRSASHDMWTELWPAVGGLLTQP